MGYGHLLDNRIQRLERQRAQARAHEAARVWYQFLVAPSCPPDKRLHIRAGLASPSARWGYIMYQSQIPDTICDFENSAETQMDLVFANANYYLPLVLCYYGDWIAYRTVSADYAEPVFDCVQGYEVATSAEAEAQIDAFLNGYTDWYYYRFPLCGVVLRNNGVLEVPASILPIDRVNRGRSYLYRDARARNSLFQ